MKKLAFILFLFFCTAFFVHGQSLVLIDGVDSTLSSNPYSIDLSNPINLIFRNSKLATSEDLTYMLYCGTDGPTADDNNLDGAVIHGNYFDYNYSSGGNTHGGMMGYNINYDVKYNYFDTSPYGVVVEGTGNMAYTSGGYAYNIFKNNRLYSILNFGQDDVPMVNNTFYNDNTGYYFIGVSENEQYSPHDTTTGAIIKNNIFYSVNLISYIKVDSNSISTLECDYNVYYCEAGDHKPRFLLDGPGGNTTVTWAEWQAMGFDEHSAVIDPDFIDTNDLIPTSRLDYGVDLGDDYEFGLSTSAEWVVGSAPDTIAQDDTWQVGAVIHSINGDYFIATTGDDDTGDGSFDNPWYSIEEASSNTSPGDTVYVRGGAYDYDNTQTISKSGTAGNRILFINYPNESPVFDFSTMTQAGPNESIYGIYAYQESYIDFHGLRVTRLLSIDTDNGRAHGWYFQDSHHLLFDECISDSIAGRGFMTYECYSIFFTYCDAHHCADPQDADPGNAGTGFLPYNSKHLNKTEDTTSMVGCRAWLCSDQGFAGATDYGVIIVDSCWSFNNGYMQYGGGQGFKMGLSPSDSMYLEITHCISANQKTINFHDNTDPTGNNQEIHAYNNLAIGGTWGFKLGGGDKTNSFSATMRNNIAFDNSDGAQYTYNQNYTAQNNSWNQPLDITESGSNFIELPADSADYITILAAARQNGGYLPDLGDYFKLDSASSLLEAGVDVGLPYNGSFPDLGPFEFEGEYDVESITISAANNSTTIEVDNGTLQMSAEVSPDTASFSNVTWSIITGTGTSLIDQAGIVTALTDGNITVRATAQDGTGIYDDYVLTLSNQVNPLVPVVSTTIVLEDGIYYITTGGNVTYDGDATVTARGVCWSTSPNPTLSDEYTVDGSGAGLYVSTPTNLNAGVLYYIRAYATNEAGTSYGVNVQATPLFTTKPMKVSPSGSPIFRGGKVVTK